MQAERTTGGSTRAACVCFEDLTGTVPLHERELRPPRITHRDTTRARSPHNFLPRDEPATGISRETKRTQRRKRTSVKHVTQRNEDARGTRSVPPGIPYRETRGRSPYPTCERLRAYASRAVQSVTRGRSPYPTCERLRAYASRAVQPVTRGRSPYPTCERLRAYASRAVQSVTRGRSPYPTCERLRAFASRAVQSVTRGRSPRNAQRSPPSSLIEKRAKLVSPRNAQRSPPSSLIEKRAKLVSPRNAQRSRTPVLWREARTDTVGVMHIARLFRGHCL